MKNLAMIAVVVFVFLALGADSAEEVWVVRPDGVGPLRIGMTLEQVNKAVDEQLVQPKDKSQTDCFYASTTKPSEVFLMMLEGRLGRIDVREPGIKTAGGVQVGDTEAKARKVYGARLKVEPQKYVEKGYYLTVMSNDGRRGIRFESVDGKITSYYAGRDQAIRLVEGCQ